MVSFAAPAPITTEHLLLTPLTVDDAGEMATVLADERLHGFIGGHPAGADELRARYEALVAGSSDPDEVWLNWIVRRQSDGRAVGTVQATVSRRGGARTAVVAWVIGIPWQGQGFASEAARALVAWLQDAGVGEVAAHIHPDHGASEAVATRAGLRPTGEQVDGEQVWRTT